MTTGTGLHDCGIDEQTGTGHIVGIEGAFTGKTLDPTADPTGLGIIMARIDSRYWPLRVCGDSGIGALFNVADNKNLDISTENIYIDPIDAPITAHACIINCDYRITVTESAQVIVAMIDGVWNIIRVLNSASTVPIVNSSNTCRCCGFTPKHTLLRARILSVTPGGCGGYQACDEFIINPETARCGNDEDNPLNIRVGCSPNPLIIYENIDDWYATVCGVEATIISVDCAAPYIDCEPSTGTGTECGCTGTGTGTGTGTAATLTRFEMIIETGPIAGCAKTGTGGSFCEYRILIYSDPELPEPCALADVTIDEVYAESCGVELAVGDRVILCNIPENGTDIARGTGTGLGCGMVEWFVLRACSDEDCNPTCDPPPPPPTTCCGILCEDLQETMTATIELDDCDCLPCSFTIVMPKVPCSPGTERGQWRYTAVPESEFFPAERKCDNYRTFFRFDEIQYFCGGEPEPDTGTGTGTGTSDAIEQTAALIFNGMGGRLIESSCNPMYAVFELDVAGICIDKFPGMTGTAADDLSCTARITITE